MQELKNSIEQAWENRELLQQEATQNAIRKVIDLIDNGKLRTAEPVDGGWQINEWVKKAVVLYFPIQKMETLEAGIFEYHDKMPLKRNYAEKGIRVVPNAVAISEREIAPDDKSSAGIFIFTSAISSPKFTAIRSVSSL